MVSKTMKYQILLLINLLFFFLFTGCDDNQEKVDDSSYYDIVNPENISFRLTRSITISDVGVNAIQEEMMYDWHLVIADATGKIEAVLHRNNFNDKVPNTSLPLEQETVHFDSYDVLPLPIVYEGWKTIYAFANMEVPVAFSVIGNTITETEARQITTTVNGNGLIPTNSTPIPMSNIIKVELKNVKHQSIDIPLIRLVAKVEFTFKTLTSTSITVQTATMNHVTLNDNDNVYLFSSWNDYLFVPSMPISSREGSHSYVVNKTVTNSSEQTHIIYVNESTKPDSEYIGFTLTTKRADKESTEIRYALTESAIALWRNDYLKIPVTMTDYEFNPRIDFYPPIGGYGDAVVSSEPGEVFFVKVTSGGQIILRPQLYNALTNLPVGDNNTQLKIEATPIAPTINTSEMFSEELAYHPVDGWWRATLNGNIGKVLFTLTFDVTGAEGYTVTLQRKIYIIKE